MIISHDWFLTALLVLSSIAFIKAFTVLVKVDDDVRLYIESYEQNKAKVLGYCGIGLALGILVYFGLNSNLTFQGFIELYLLFFIPIANIVLIGKVLIYAVLLKNIKPKLWDNLKKPAFMTVMAFLLGCFHLTLFN